MVRMENFTTQHDRNEWKEETKNNFSIINFMLALLYSIHFLEQYFKICSGVAIINVDMKILLRKVKANEMRQLEVSSLAMCRGMKKWKITDLKGKLFCNSSNYNNNNGESYKLSNSCLRWKNTYRSHSLFGIEDEILCHRAWMDLSIQCNFIKEFCLNGIDVLESNVFDRNKRDKCTYLMWPIFFLLQHPTTTSAKKDLYKYQKPITTGNGKPLAENGIVSKCISISII